jgi:predicted HicB family RNase H-like nuclease
MNTLKYKDYIGQVEIDDEAGIIYGEVINTRDVITFEGKTVAEVRQAFEESVDDYLEFCKERNENPEKPFSGIFNLRLGPEKHREAFIRATEDNTSLNKWVADAIEEKLHKSG